LYRALAIKHVFPALLASAGPAWPQGENLPDGTDRISDLGPGTWEIVAEIPVHSVETKSEARGRVTIPPGALRVRLVLDFGAPQR
jgi:hypothetical protein